MASKKMNDYTVRCTEEQTNRAKEYGAPIEDDIYYDGSCHVNMGLLEPTFEQMLRWLFEMGCYPEIRFYGYDTDTFEEIYEHRCLGTRPNVPMPTYTKGWKNAALKLVDQCLDYMDGK